MDFNELKSGFNSPLGCFTEFTDNFLDSLLTQRLDISTDGRAGEVGRSKGFPFDDLSGSLSPSVVELDRGNSSL
jgi:hypothetical protein